MPRLKDALLKLARPPEEVRAANLRQWASSVPNVVAIDTVRPRERCRVAGVITNIRIDPRQGSGAIEATINDGNGEMVAKWLGRSSLSGVTLGMGLIMEGIAGRGTGEELVLLNPEYELVPGPEHG